MLNPFNPLTIVFALGVVVGLLSHRPVRTGVEMLKILARGHKPPARKPSIRPPTRGIGLQ